MRTGYVCHTHVLQGKNPLKARILVLEEHPLLRDGIADFLNAQPDLLVCGAADNIRDDDL